MRNVRYDFLHLPKKFHGSHQNCEFLVYQLEDFVRSKAYAGLRIQRIKLNDAAPLIENEHLLDYLLRVERTEDHKKIITSHVLNAIIGDICQFLQLALFSSLQARLTVTFSLLRKPFVYHLLVILRLYLTEDFLDRFNQEDGFDTTGLSQEDIIELVNASEMLLTSSALKAIDLYDFVFNPVLGDSLVNISNKALHPSTTRNQYNKTPIQHINFVFSTKDDLVSQWDYLYRRLPFLLLYLNEVLDSIVFHHLNLDEKLYNKRLKERAYYLKQK